MFAGNNSIPKDEEAKSLMESAPPSPKKIQKPEKVEVSDFGDMYIPPENLKEAINDSVIDDVPPFDMDDIPPMPDFEDFNPDGSPRMDDGDPNGDIFD